VLLVHFFCLTPRVLIFLSLSRFFVPWPALSVKDFDIRVLYISTGRNTVLRSLRSRVLYLPVWVRYFYGTLTCGMRKKWCFVMDSFIMPRIVSFKGCLTRDFRLQVFFINQFPPALFWIFMKIRGIIRNFVFIAGVPDKWIIVPTYLNFDVPLRCRLLLVEL
jgi:hypothetical protein